MLLLDLLPCIKALWYLDLSATPPLTLSMCAGYVEQFDTLVPELTVREMLLYTAELKCPRSEPLSQKRRRVDQLLSTLALQGCAHTVIGNVLTRCISGGQVRAVRIKILTETSTAHNDDA